MEERRSTIRRRLKRFRHFVNSDEPDANVVFVAEREQIRPARPEERETDLEVA